VTINVKPETQNWRLEPTCLATQGKTHSLTGTGPGLARQESAGRVFGRFWNRTDPFLWSKPGPLAGYLDQLLALGITDRTAEVLAIATIYDAAPAEEARMEGRDETVRHDWGGLQASQYAGATHDGELEKYQLLQHQQKPKPKLQLTL
jgi:hypothetical protein